VLAHSLPASPPEGCRLPWQFFENLPGLQVVQFALSSIAVIIGVVMLIAFLAGTLPTRATARQNPVAALRYE